MVVPFREPERSLRASLQILLVDCWSKKIIIIIIELKRHCILVHLGPLPTSELALLASLIGTPHPIHGPPILFLQRHAKPTSIVMIINTQTNVDSTVLATSMVVPFPEPERSWRASFLIFLVDCWSKKILIIIRLERHRILVHLGPLSPDFWTCSPWFSHWHTSPNLWPSNPRPAKICKTHKCCHENKHTNKPWFYSFGNRCACPLPRAWTVLTSLLADPLGGLLVKKIIIIVIELKRHCILVHLGPLPTSGLALLVSLIGTPRPIYGPPILFLERHAKPTSIVTIINTQTNVDSTVLATSMVVPNLQANVSATIRLFGGYSSHTPFFDWQRFQDNTLYPLTIIHMEHINVLDFDDKSERNLCFSFGNSGIIFNGASAQLFPPREKW